MSNNSNFDIYKFSVNSYTSSSSTKENGDGTWTKVTYSASGFKIVISKDTDGNVTSRYFDPYGNPCGMSVKDKNGRVVDSNSNSGSIFDS